MFDYSQKICTFSGSRTVFRLRPGDRVIGVSKGKYHITKVYKFYNRGIGRAFREVIGESYIITCTLNTRLWNYDKNCFVEMKTLKEGDNLGYAIKVENIEPVRLIPRKILGITKLISHRSFKYMFSTKSSNCLADGVLCRPKDFDYI